VLKIHFGSALSILHGVCHLENIMNGVFSALSYLLSNSVRHVKLPEKFLSGCSINWASVQHLESRKIRMLIWLPCLMSCKPQPG
jgi:hypothetical protein